MLRLTQRHAVTRNDDDVFRILQGERGFGFRFRLCLVLFLREFGNQRVEGILRVAEQQTETVLAGVERILNARVAGAEVEVAHDDLGRFVDVQDRHAVDRRAFRFARGGVHDVACADDHDRVAVLEIVVDRVELVEMLVIDVRFREQHVHVTGHASRDRMDRETHGRAVRLELVAKLLDLVLRLTQRHAVTRNDDDVLRILQGERGFGFRFRLCLVLFLREFGNQRVEGILRVAEQQTETVLAGVERILNARVAGAEVEVAHDDLGRFVDVQDRHAVDRRAFRFARGGVHDVACADDHDRVAVLEIVVDRVELVEMLVVDVRFREQHVHVTGHAARDRMDRETHGRAVRFELVAKLLDLMLRLTQRHAVAGNDDDVFRILQGERGFGLGLGLGFGRGRFFLLLGGLVELDRLAEQDVHEVPVHSAAHDLGEQQTAGADDAADRDEQDVTDRHTRDRARHAGQRVQQRDRDGHIGAADAHGEQPAEQQTRGRAEHERDDIQTLERREHDARKAHEQQRRGKDAVTLELSGTAVDLTRKLQRGDQRAGKRDRADDERERGGDVRENGAAALCKLNSADQRACKTADAVQQRDGLGHFDHLDLLRPEETDDRADRHRAEHREQDPEPLDRDERRKLSPTRQNDREQHDADAQEVAGDRGADLALHRKTDQNERREDRAENEKQIDRHCFSTSLSFLRNMRSILCVTANPPATLIMASAAAASAMIISGRLPCSRIAAMSAPSTVTPDSAFMPDISGVCRRLGTFLMMR